MLSLVHEAMRDRVKKPVRSDRVQNTSPSAPSPSASIQPNSRVTQWFTTHLPGYVNHMPSNEYMREYMARRRKDRRAKLLEMSGNRCSACESTKELEFNHIDRSAKLFVLSGYALDKAWKTIEDEWRKCELLCSDCHKLRTREQWDTQQLTAWNKNLHGDHKHGSPRMYNERGCRCDRCKTAKRIYRNGGCKSADVVA